MFRYTTYLCGWVEKESTTEREDVASITGLVNQSLYKLVFTASLLGIQH